MLMILSAVWLQTANAATVADCTGFTPPDPNFANVTCNSLCSASVDPSGNVTATCDLEAAYSFGQSCVGPDDPVLIVVANSGGHDIVAMAYDTLGGSPLVPVPDFCCAIDAGGNEQITTVDALGSCADDEIYFECGTMPVNDLNCTTAASLDSPNGVVLTATARGKDFTDRIYGSSTNSGLYVEILRAGDNGNSVVPDYVYGFGGDDEIHGGPGNDTLWGGDGNDVIFDAFGGSATLNGEGGEDCLVGGTAAETLSGGNQNDVLIGGGGNDTLKGGYHSDLLIGANTASTTSGTVLYDGDAAISATDFIDTTATTIAGGSNADGATNTCDTGASGLTGCSTLTTSTAVRAAATFTSLHPLCPSF